MDIRITRRNIEVEDSLKPYIESKVEKLLRVFARVQSVEIVFKGQRHRCTCEIEVVAKPFHVVGSVEEKTPRTAFDLGLKTVQGALKKQKQRLIKNKRSAGTPTAPTTEMIIDEEIAAEEEEE